MLCSIQPCGGTRVYTLPIDNVKVFAYVQIAVLEGTYAYIDTFHHANRRESQTLKY